MSQPFGLWTALIYVLFLAWYVVQIRFSSPLELPRLSAIHKVTNPITLNSLTFFKNTRQ